MSVRIGSLSLALCACLFSVGAGAQQADKNAERAARRAQLQVQAAQQQLQEAQAAKTKLEADKAAADKLLTQQTEQAGRARGQLQKATAQLRGAEAARLQLVAAVAALEKQLAEQKRAGDEALAKQARELTQFIQQRDTQLAGLQRKHDDQVTQVGECTARNTRLVKLSAELVDRWRNKSVSDVIKQRDVVLGLTDVQTFNLVQDYRDKAEAERFVPSINR